MAFATMIDALAKADIVLVAERHNDFAHHRAQQEVITALLGRGPVAVGMESFPSGRNPVLERWAAGDLASYDAFLEAVGWFNVWGVDPALYRGVLETVRRHRVPLVGINIPRPWIRTIAREGRSELTAAAHERIGSVAEPPAAYRESLRESLAEHDGGGRSAAGFIRAQTAWDAAMAGALLSARQDHPDAVVVGLAGTGHVRDGHGIPHQIGARDGDVVVRSVLPFDPAEEETPGAGAADFAWPMAGDVAAEAVRLGVTPGSASEGAGIPVTAVAEDSPASRAGVRAGDHIRAVDGEGITSRTALIRAIRAHQWGGCLRLTIARKGKERIITVPLERTQTG
ncbi:MAG TPA: ChaN family lipoprotein, partial [Gammaproteobacteria bacterium]|nr:ChaN family lipoprotein [Gammaproteobacteria bacterium]